MGLLNLQGVLFEFFFLFLGSQYFLSKRDVCRLPVFLALSCDLKRRLSHLSAVVYIEQHPGFGDYPKVLLLALLPFLHFLLFF